MHSGKRIAVAVVIIVNDAVQVCVVRENMNHARRSMGRERKRVVLFLHLSTVFGFAWKCPVELHNKLSVEAMSPEHRGDKSPTLLVMTRFRPRGVAAVMRKA